MSVYSYTAVDNVGRKRIGMVDAVSQNLAINLLKNQGLYVIEIKERRTTLLDDFLNLKGVSGGELVSFTRQFSTMISAGLPLSKSLEIMANQTEGNVFRRILTDVLRDVEGGTSVSAALARYPKVFSPTYIALVRAGESSGKLDVILQRLASNMEAERELESNFKGVMIYPAIVFTAMIGVFIIMMVFVVPKLASMYETMNVPLPIVTKMMIVASDFLVKNKFLLGFGAVAAFFGLRSFSGTEEGKKIINMIKFMLPVFGKIIKQKELTDYTRTLSLLIASAIPIVESLNIVSKTVTSQDLVSATLLASRSVEKGNNLSDFFKNNKAFPSLLGQMASVGEETGKMDETLGRVAEYFQGEVNHSVKGLSSALEPFILIVLGVMVGGLIISIITPIYKITSSF